MTDTISETALQEVAHRLGAYVVAAAVGKMKESVMLQAEADVETLRRAALKRND